MMSYYDVIHYEKDKNQKDSEQPDLNQRPKDISFNQLQSSATTN